MSEITRFPICWPDNVARTAPQNRGVPKFDELSYPAARDFVTAEINRLNKRLWNYTDESVIISCNLRFVRNGVRDHKEPSDPAVAVYFQLRFLRNGKEFFRPCVLTCDKWCRIGLNLTAIAKDIEAQRSRERWGCTTIEQAFQGYVAIPEKCGGKAWWEILGILPTATKLEIDAAYRGKAKLHHPDTGGSQSKWLPFAEAYEQAMAQFRG